MRWFWKELRCYWKLCSSLEWILHQEEWMWLLSLCWIYSILHICGNSCLWTKLPFAQFFSNRPYLSKETIYHLVRKCTLAYHWVRIWHWFCHQHLISKHLHLSWNWHSPSQWHQCKCYFSYKRQVLVSMSWPQWPTWSIETTYRYQITTQHPFPLQLYIASTYQFLLFMEFHSL